MSTENEMYERTTIKSQIEKNKRRTITRSVECRVRNKIEREREKRRVWGDSEMTTKSKKREREREKRIRTSNDKIYEINVIQMFDIHDAHRYLDIYTDR